MTRHDPSLLVNRLLVERGTTAVYDERFHAGVNIIRGANSSGKSTVLNFLFYALGGDLSDWSEVARRCTRVTVEVSFNGIIATLSREVSSETRQPMDIFGGPMSAALTAPRAEWTRYPYLRSTSRESFSQAIFRLLQVPEVGNDASGNITPGGWSWRYALRPDGTATEVTLTYEWSRTPQAFRDAIGGMPPFPPEYLDASLASLERAVTSAPR